MSFYFLRVFGVIEDPDSDIITSRLVIIYRHKLLLCEFVLFNTKNLFTVGFLCVNVGEKGLSDYLCFLL